MKTIIVGSGVGGLVTALYLSKRGEEVVIYEKDQQAGGRLAFVERDGYKIDKGPTIVLLPNMIYDILCEVGIRREELEMVRIDPMYRLSYPDGFDFLKWSDIDKQIEEIGRVFPGEENGFLAYLEQMKWRFEKGKEAFLDRSFVKKSAFLSPDSLKTLWKLKAYQTVKGQAESYFTHPRLQEAFSFQTLYVGGAPFNSPAMYSLVPFSEHQHGIWYIKGGYASFVQLLVKKLEERGVTIKLNSCVEELETTGRHCNGVIVNGKREQADRIVLNGDFPLARKLIKGREKHKSYVPSSACLLLYIGVNKIFDEAEVHQFLMTDDFKQHMQDVFIDKKLPKAPSMYVFHPSKIDPTLAPENKGVLYVLIPVPSGKEVDWSQIGDYVDRRLDELEARGFSGLREAIEWIDIRTPEDARQEGLYEGGSFGIAPILSQSGVFRPQLKPFNLHNVYAVGASTHPGGGIPIVMQGAKLLANYLHEESLQSASI